MATKFMSVVMALTLMFLCAFGAQAAGTGLPLAKHDGGINSPQVLAERIGASLEKDASGNTVVDGAYISPNDFLHAVQRAGGEVGNVTDLAEYVRELRVAPMPEGITPLSRILKKMRGGKTSYVLDLSGAWKRAALRGEQGWFDTQTGALIFAGACSNTSLAPITPPPPPPEPAPVYHAPPPPQRVVERMPLGDIPRVVCPDPCNGSPTRGGRHVQGY